MLFKSITQMKGLKNFQRLDGILILDGKEKDVRIFYKM